MVPVAEYVRITSIASNVEVDYNYPSEFITAKTLRRHGWIYLPIS
jgi:hypothetical protein